MQTRGAQSGEQGATSIYILVLLVPVLLGFVGFAVDLGRLYLIRGELKVAANSMALAAATRLIGTEAASAEANKAARLAVENTGGFANRYDFGQITIGEGSGRLASALPEPTFYETASAATGEGGGSDESGGNAARYVRIDLTAEAPLIFWGLLSLGQERKTPIAVRAVAGVSAPLCTACGIEPVAVAPLDPADTANFGFSQNTRYTLGYLCTGTPVPGALLGAQRVNYLLLDRYNEEAELFPEENSQAYRIGAGGLPSSSNAARSCLQINAQEPVWTSAAPLACNTNRVPAPIQALTCGLASRFDSALPGGCDQISAAADIITAFPSDTDRSDLEDYSAYVGNTRRIITVAVVEALDATNPMTILGFRQFLIQPTQGEGEDGTLGTTDVNGRFVATYLGSVMPLRGGSFAGCTQTSGPGKVVLQQ